MQKMNSTDIYSMGAVFFNMLTGEKPYNGSTLEEIVQQHLHTPVPKLPSRYRHWQFLLDRMMSKDKEQPLFGGGSAGCYAGRANVDLRNIRLHRSAMESGWPISC